MGFESKLREILQKEINTVEPPPHLRYKILNSLKDNHKEVKMSLKKKIIIACTFIILAFPSLAIGGYDYAYFADKIFGSRDRIGATEEEYRDVNKKFIFASKILSPGEFAEFMKLSRQLADFWVQYPESKGQNGEIDVTKLPPEKQKDYQELQKKLQPYFDKLNEAEANGIKEVVEVKNPERQGPQPYKLAEEAIVTNRWDDAVRNLEATIKDHANSDYAYQAKILKSIIYLARARSYEDQAMAYSEGSKTVGEGKGEFLTKSHEAKKQAQQQLVLLAAEMKEILKESKLQTVYINFTDYRFIQKKSQGSSDWVADFGLNGTKEERDRALAWRMNYNFALYTLYMTGHLDEAVRATPIEGNIVFPAYFSLIGEKLYASGEETKATGKELLKHVLVLTQGDKLNRYRLEAEEILKNDP